MNLFEFIVWLSVCVLHALYGMSVRQHRQGQYRGCVLEQHILDTADECSHSWMPKRVLACLKAPLPTATAHPETTPHPCRHRFVRPDWCIDVCGENAETNYTPIRGFRPHWCIELFLQIKPQNNYTPIGITFPESRLVLGRLRPTSGVWVPGCHWACVVYLGCRLRSRGRI